MEQIFKNEVQSDSITLNYTLQEPEKYGIKNYVPTFGNYSIKDMKDGITTGKQYLKKLKQFDYSTLSESQKITYDVLSTYLEDQGKNKKLLYYNETLSPTTGLQAQLPVLLAEYHFTEKQDIVDYLELLPKINDYFKQIISFEKQKSKKGLFMSTAAVNDVISQCQAFISNPKNNYMITLFNSKMDQFEGLTDQEKINFKSKNEAAVFNHVIPAYKELISALCTLKDTGKNSQGLSHFKDGKDYYKYLVKTVTGSSRSMKNINSLLDSTITANMKKLSQISKDDPEILNKIQNYYYPLTNPDEILTYLKGVIDSDFPSLKETECCMKYVDKSLEDYLSPAFYLTPALDSTAENCIYINKNQKYDLSEIFPTIAHEGYPGHLYQNCYYNQTSPCPLRCLLNFEGYSEGWATYAELYSYSVSGLDTSVAKLLKYNTIIMLCLDAKCDIGINYYGWSMKDTMKYLKNFGITSTEGCQKLYNYIVEEPCNYLKYTLGYLEFQTLRNKAQKQLGEKFNAKEFHTFLLDMGPCQFEVLDKYLEKWMKTQ